MLNPPTRGTLIGDNVRDKWLAFLGRAFELGYITQIEFDTKSQTILAARTAEEITPVLSEFAKSDIDAWSAQWKPSLPSLFNPDPPATAVPVPPRPLFVRALPTVMGLLIVIMIVIAVCIELAR